MAERQPVSSAERLLFLSGLLCIFLAMALGVLFAFVVSHVANAGIKEAWMGILTAVSLGDSTTVRAHFETITELSAMRGRIMNSHSHLGASGLLALLLAVLLPLASLPSPVRRLLARAVLAGVILQFGGVLGAWYFNFKMIYLADLGAVLLFAGVAVLLYGLVKRDGHAPGLANYLQSRLASKSSRLLLKAGTVFLLLFMLLGMYLAWLIVSGGETHSLAAVAQAVEHLMQQDVEKASSAIGTFKFTQAKSAINAASHSHGLVLAMFMLLLALLRPLINLGEKVFHGFCLVYIVLSFALPLWIFLAINVWFNFRFFANYTGILLAILTLFIIYGAIRQGGNRPATDGEAT